MSDGAQVALVLVLVVLSVVNGRWQGGSWSAIAGYAALGFGLGIAALALGMLL